MGNTGTILRVDYIQTSTLADAMLWRRKKTLRFSYVERIEAQIS